MFLNSFIVQGITAVIMFLYYYLVTLTLDVASQNIFFILISVVAISIMLTDFSFAITNIQSSHNSQVAIDYSIGSRNILIAFTTVAAIAFWQFNHDKLGLSSSLIVFATVLQITELISPFFVLIVADKGIIAQAVKLLKFSLISVILLTTDVTLKELIAIHIGINILIFIGLLLYLERYLRLHLSKQLLNFTFSNIAHTKLYLKNFSPNLGGLLIGTVIPVFGLQFLNAQDLNKLVLMDRFARSFENIFQAILQWNLKRLKKFTPKDVIIYSTALTTVGLTTIGAAPKLMQILLNVEFDHIDNIHLQTYCTIIFLGPLITMLGTKYYIFSGRTLEYSLMIIVLGILAIIWISSINDILSIAFGLPLLYATTLLMLLLRKKERSMI